MFDFLKKKVSCVNCVHLVAGKTLICKNDDTEWLAVEMCAVGEKKVSSSKVCSSYVCKHK